MQAKKIIRLINGEIDFTEDSLNGLKHLVEEYPYFQVAHLLYTLNLQTARDSRVNAALRKAACHLSDRQNLFYRIRSDSFPPDRIEKLEGRERPVDSSPFVLIDTFLAEQGEGENDFSTTTISQEEIPTDYVFDTLPDLPGNPETEKHQDEIDKFLEEIEKSPVKIVLKGRPEDESDMPFSDLETVEDGSFFSETLAKIYFKQKKYEKALEIIQQLYLLNPEKNRYFADQIRFLEKLVNNTKK